MIKSYFDFLIESILYTSPEFNNIIGSMNDPISGSLRYIISDRSDINTNFNAIDVTDKNDTISFTPESQFQRKVSSGLSIKDLFANKSNKTSVGRVVKSILDANGIKKTPVEIEEFVNKFKSTYDTKKGVNIKVVKGEDIRYWYSAKRYCNDTNFSNKGSLGKSCMRSWEAQDYLDIYVENTDVCSLIIKVNANNELESRALLWKTNKGLFVDRIYYTYDSDSFLIENWARNQYKDVIVSDYDSYSKLEVQLSSSKAKYDYYPYMDSLPYYDSINRKLFSYEPSEKKGVFFCHETDGGVESRSRLYSEWEQEYIEEDEAVYSSIVDSYLLKDDSYYSEYYSEKNGDVDAWIPKSVSVYSNKLKSYLYEDRSVNYYIDVDRRKNDYTDENDEDIGYDEITMCDILKIHLDEHNGSYYLKGKYVVLYRCERSSMDKYSEIYNHKTTSLPYIPKIDSEIFGIEIDEEDIEYESFDKYYRLYRYIIYKDFVKMIKDLDIDEELKKSKLEDLEKVNNNLNNGKDDYYSANNYIIEEWGNYDKMLSAYKDAVNDYFKSDEFKPILKSIDSYDFEDKEAVKDLVKDFAINPTILNKNIDTIIYYHGSNAESLNFEISMYKKLGIKSPKELNTYLRIIYSLVKTIRNHVYIILDKSMGTKEYRRYIACVEFYFQNVNNIDPQQKA